MSRTKATIDRTFQRLELPALILSLSYPGGGGGIEGAGGAQEEGGM